MNPRSPHSAADPPTAGAALAELLGMAPLPQLSALAAAHRGRVYLVGGALRDAMLGRDVSDLDIVVEADLEGFLRSVAVAAGRDPSPIGDRWRQTHRMRWHGRQIDLALLLGPLDEDLVQRDFTVNSMALPLPAPADIAAALTDPHGGREDLELRVIRCASVSVLDADPLRMLRAVRYLSTLPGFQLDPATAEAITARVERISDVAPERIQTEWKHLLDGERWITGVEMARRFGLAARSFSVVEDMAVAMAWSKYGDETGLSTTCGVQALSVRLAAVLSGDVRTLGRKPVGNALLSLKWPTRLVRQALHIAEWACRAPGTDERELVEWVLADAAAAAAAAALAQAWFHAREDQVPLGVSNLRVLAQRAAEPRWVTGGDLRSWGMNEGRELGGVLAEAGRGQLLRRWDGAQPAREWARGRAALIGRTAAGGAPPRTPERDR